MGNMRIGGRMGDIPRTEEELHRFPGGLADNTVTYYRAACCTCPWVSPYYAVKAQAVEAGEGHLREEPAHRYTIQTKTVPAGSGT